MTFGDYKYSTVSPKFGDQNNDQFFGFYTFIPLSLSMEATFCY